MNKPKITLVMIVKNEAQVIERCLDSVKDFATGYCIVDTGSTDDTEQILDNFYEARLAEEADFRFCNYRAAWVDFGTNRTDAMNLARRDFPDTDYFLVMDADMELVCEAGQLLPPKADFDQYMMEIKDGGAAYKLPVLLRADLPWKSIGKTHEYWTCDALITKAELGGAYIRHFADGGERANKFTRDIELLNEEVRQNRGNTRAWFYLGNSYRDIGDMDKAAWAYQERCKLKGWNEEEYVARIELAKCYMYWCEHDPNNTIAMKRKWTQDAQTALFEAFELLPRRREAQYWLSALYRSVGRHTLAYQWSRHCDEDDEREIYLLFVENWIWDWGLRFEHSINLYYAGQYQEAINQAELLLEAPNMPVNTTVQVVKNKIFSEDKLNTLSRAM